MKPRYTSIIIVAFLMSCFGAVFAADICPLCGGTAVKAEKLQDDTSQPSRNLCVWWRSGTNALHGAQIPVCTQCWFSFDTQLLVMWQRWSELPDSFYHPLCDAIRHFPMTDSSANYAKTFEGVKTNETYRLVTVPGGKGNDIQWSEITSFDCLDVKVHDNMNYGCKDSKELMDKLHDYCAQHELAISEYRYKEHPGEVCGSITSKPMPCRFHSATGAKQKDYKPPTLASAATRCPLCGGRLVKADSLKDDTRKPSKNLEMWNRSICLNPARSVEAVICTRCWFSFSPGWSEGWERCSEVPDSFRYPPPDVIRQLSVLFPTTHAWGIWNQKFVATKTNDTTRVVPLPGGSKREIKWRVIHSLEYSDVKVQQEVYFWCKDSEEQIAKFRDYCAKHELSVERCDAKPERGEVLFTITTQLMTYQPRSAAAVKPKGNKP